MVKFGTDAKADQVITIWQLLIVTYIHLLSTLIRQSITRFQVIALLTCIYIVAKIVH